MSKFKEPTLRFLERVLNSAQEKVREIPYDTLHSRAWQKYVPRVVLANTKMVLQKKHQDTFTFAYWDGPPTIYAEFLVVLNKRYQGEVRASYGIDMCGMCARNEDLRSADPRWAISASQEDDFLERIPEISLRDWLLMEKLATDFDD